MPCRLLYLVGQLRLGGLERQLYYLLANLNYACHKPAVVVWNLDTEEKYYRDIQALNIPIYGFPVAWSPLKKLRSFRSVTRKLNPEIIHSYGFHTNFAAYYGARGTTAVAIGSIRSDLAWARRQGGLLKGALNARWPDLHISNSMASAKTNFGPRCLFSPRKISVVRNGLDLNRFSCSETNTAMKTYVAAIGTLSVVKRWDRLLRVVQKVNGMLGREVNLRIAGDGPLRAVLKKQTDEMGISKSVEFQGATQDISTFLKGAKVLVHVSESEGCPNAVMEAMACGLPVVAMETGDIPYLVEEGRTGFVVPQGEETTFAQRICKLLRDDELCTSMGLAARTKAEREFSLERLVSETLAVYKTAGWKDES